MTEAMLCWFFGDKSERIESIEEQRKYFEEHQDEFAERIRRYNSGIANVR